MKLQLLHQTKVRNGLIKSYLLRKPLVKLPLLHHQSTFSRQRGQRVDRSTRRRSEGHDAGDTGLPMEHVQHAWKLGQLERQPTHYLLEKLVYSSQLPRRPEVAS